MKHLFLMISMLFLHRFNAHSFSYYIVLPNFSYQENYKENALTVLENRCNVCHIKKQKELVFTRDNMVQYSFAIEQQVFIKKRMPKGRRNKLTTTEQNNLKLWLEALKNH